MAARVRFTRERRERFLELLRETGNVSDAARAAGVSRSRVYQVRAESEPFARQWEDAVGALGDRIEAEAVRRALHGVEEPYYYQGEERGTVRKYSDTLLMFLLKSRCPERYGECGSQQRAAETGAPPSPVVFELNFEQQEPNPDGGPGDDPGDPSATPCQ